MCGFQHFTLIFCAGIWLSRTGVVNCVCFLNFVSVVHRASQYNMFAKVCDGLSLAYFDLKFSYCALFLQHPKPCSVGVTQHKLEKNRVRNVEAIL